MGIFDAVSRAFTLPSGANSIADFTGAGASAPIPQIPEFLKSLPIPQLPALMPSILSPDVKQAGRNALLNLLGRQGRASTILTSRKRKRAAETTNFDSYSGSTL